VNVAVHYLIDYQSKYHPSSLSDCCGELLLVSKSCNSRSSRRVVACIILLGVELRLDIVVASTDFIIIMEHDIMNSRVIDSIVGVFICGDGLLS